MMLGNPKGRFPGLDRCPRATGAINLPPAQELENQRFSWNQNKAWGPHAGLEETSKGFFLGQEAPLHGGGCEERSPQTATAPATPTRPPPRHPRPRPCLPPPALPDLPHPRPARPGPALTHLQTQGRPAGAQELADVAQALVLVPRLRVDLQHTAALSGPDASSAPLPRAAPISAPARTRKRAQNRK